MDTTKKTTFFTLAVLVALSVTTVMMLFGAAKASADCGDPTVVTLYGGQTIDVGTVTISNDETFLGEKFLYIKYNTTGDWDLIETHLSVATDLDDIPQTKSGNPIPGKFQYKTEYDPAVT